jgi:hypoxanthine-DNA glycosylase
MTELKTSFAPLVEVDTQILILGTLPGDRSLALGEYYGHPQNRFWKVVAKITGNDLPTTWSDKKDMLRRVKIGLWDVAYRANRKGSLDSAIRDEEPNDILGLIMEHKGIRTVCFNGKSPEKLYDKYFDRLSGVEYVSLPGTSPANAAANLEQLCERWRRIVDKKI